MQFDTRIPGPRLKPFVESMWLYRGDPRPHALERIMPTGAAQLIVNLDEDRTRIYHPARADACETMPGTVLCGAHSRYGVIDTAEQHFVFGVSFRPGGTYPFFDVPSNEVANTHVPIELLWCRARASRLRQRIQEAPTAQAMFDAVEDELTDLTPPAGLHPAVGYALDLFDRAAGTSAVGCVTEAIALSPKRFIDVFKAAVGLTPKAYCRVRRFQRALRAAHAGASVDWPAVALACGYFASRISSTTSGRFQG
jgi:AraC-like DNA-binding protein